MGGGTVQQTVGDDDPSGLTNPGELHLNLGAPGAAASSGVLAVGFNWWWIVVIGAAVLILKR
jgi:hypothetical protein